MTTKNDLSENGARPLAIVTGASSGIGYYLAQECAENGFDLVIAATIRTLVKRRRNSALWEPRVDLVETDLATTEGIDELYNMLDGRTVDALLANAGHGLPGHAFLDQEFNEARHVVDTNITGTIYLLHKAGRDMRRRGKGRILITG